jgi:hypothetical protein
MDPFPGLLRFGMLPWYHHLAPEGQSRFTGKMRARRVSDVSSPVRRG